MVMVVLKKSDFFFWFSALYYFILMFDVECSVLIPEKHGCEGKGWG